MTITSTKARPGGGAAKRSTSTIAPCPPRSSVGRLRPSEEDSAAINSTVVENTPATKPFDAVEQKLSRAMDALMDAIDAYRALQR